jgi:hypothetical protein
MSEQLMSEFLSFMDLLPEKDIDITTNALIEASQLSFRKSIYKEFPTADHKSIEPLIVLHEFILESLYKEIGGLFDLNLPISSVNIPKYKLDAILNRSQLVVKNIRRTIETLNPN